METIKKIYIDYREHGRIRTAEEKYQQYNPVKTNLPYGDFIFIGDQGTQILFEYKTGQDFLNSIRNNHLHNQTVEASSHFDYQFIIVECFSLHDMMNTFYYNTGIDIDYRQVNGAIASLNQYSTVLFAQNRDIAFDLMERQAKKILENKPLRWKFGKKTTNPALNYLSTIKGLSKQATSICKKLGLHTLEDLLILSEEDLMTVDGIGKRKARMIIRAIRGK